MHSHRPVKPGRNDPIWRHARLPIAAGVALIMVAGLSAPAGLARDGKISARVVVATRTVPPAAGNGVKARIAAPPDAGTDGATAPGDITRIVQARPGDTFMKVLRRAGASRADAHDAIAAMRAVFKPRRLKPGLRIAIRLREAANTAKKPRLMGLSFDDGIARGITVQRGMGGAFTATATARKLFRKLARVSGTIRSSLYRSAIAAGLAPRTLARLIRLYSWDVDFQRDIQPGDSFDVVIERLFDEAGGARGTGAIVYARLTLGGLAYPLYRFDSGNGRFEYFDPKGRSAQKALMKTPIDGARLSSGYGRRRHPILGYTRMHRGVDFAAPRGTPIFAAGDGIIASIGRNGAYGRYIRIRHNARYVTAYGHLHRYARKLRRGKRVRQGQVIGYVGSSGRSTGPHLHYEILVDGRRKNPMRLRLPAGRRLTGAERRRFDATRAGLDRRIAGLAPVIRLTRR